MKIINKPVRAIQHGVGGFEQGFVDMETIRRRVARIKNEWSTETIQARAKEGARRREELESLLLDRLTDIRDSEETCDLSQHGFCLVG